MKATGAPGLVLLTARNLQTEQVDGGRLAINPKPVCLNTIKKTRALKSSQNKKELNDVTAVQFTGVFLLLAAEKKTPKTEQL